MQLYRFRNEQRRIAHTHTPSVLNGTKPASSCATTAAKYSAIVAYECATVMSGRCEHRIFFYFSVAFSRSATLLCTSDDDVSVLLQAGYDLWGRLCADSLVGAHDEVVKGSGEHGGMQCDELKRNHRQLLFSVSLSICLVESILRYLRLISLVHLDRSSFQPFFLLTPPFLSFAFYAHRSLTPLSHSLFCQ